MTEPTRNASIESDAPKPDQVQPASAATTDAVPVATAAVGDSAAGADNESPYLGTTLNSLAASASVNNITGEVSLTVPLVDIPSSQGLGPRLTINLVYNSTSAG
jgi:hypothetical protein